MKSLYIIDVANLFHRAYWGTDPLVNSKGQPVNALHGFINTISQIVRTHNPDYLALALESSTPTFRKSLSKDYKANRQEMAPELKSQFQLLPSLLTGLNYPTFQANGFEADDIIGTLARDGALNGLNVVIVSCDKDFCQLITEQITIYNPNKESFITKVDVMGKYGIFPEQFVDYLAIVGDSSDGFKGVEGIGPKGAAKLLQEYGTLEEVYRNVLSIKGATQNKLLKSEDSAKLSKQLAKIITNIPLGTNLLEAIKFQGYNKELLKVFLKEQELNYHFRNLIGEEEAQVIGGILIGKAIFEV